MDLSYLELTPEDEAKLARHLSESGMDLPFVIQMKERFGCKISKLSQPKLVDLITQYAQDVGRGQFAIDPMQPYSQLVLRLLKQQFVNKVIKK